MIMIFVWLCAGMFVSAGLLGFKPVTSVKTERMWRAFGYDSLHAEAQAAGLKLQPVHYALMLGSAAAVGGSVAYWTANFWFVGAGVAIGMLVPKIIIAAIKYRRRKNLLMNLPSNLRLFKSKLLDCKSIQKSLEMSLPMMQGETKPVFQQMYDSLLLGLDVGTVLERAKSSIHLRKFDECCQKLLTGHREGFHTKSIKGISESIADIDSDIQLLQEIDIENEKKRMEPFLVFGICIASPFLFRYMESQMTDEFALKTTLETGLGKLLIASMVVSIVVGLWQRDKLLRLNLDEL